jgi:hypothetical protein
MIVMKGRRTWLISIAAITVLGIVLTGCAAVQKSDATDAPAAAAGDALPSWNDGPAKSAIIEFVQTATDKANMKFVPPAQRIAVFDNDGTLWA